MYTNFEKTFWYKNFFFLFVASRDDPARMLGSQYIENDIITHLS